MLIGINGGYFPAICRVCFVIGSAAQLQDSDSFKGKKFKLIFSLKLELLYVATVIMISKNVHNFDWIVSSNKLSENLCRRKATTWAHCGPK